METVGFVLFGLLFVLAGYNHIKGSEGSVAYATSANFPVPSIAGWPTGILLLVIGVGVALQSIAALWLAIGFLVVSAYYFHRNLADPGLTKNIALAGAALALIGLL